MKEILLLLIFMVAISCYGQQATEFKANNGITYKIGDTIKLGLGSDSNGDFVFLKRGWKIAHTSSCVSSTIGKAYANGVVVVREMRTNKVNGVVKMYFTVSSNKIIYSLLAINDAIEVCEIKPCKANNK